MQANVYTETQRTELAQTSLQREERRTGLWLGDRALVTPPRQTSGLTQPHQGSGSIKEEEAESVQEPEEGEEI